MTKGGESFAMERVHRTQRTEKSRSSEKRELAYGTRQAPDRANFNTGVFEDRCKRRTPNSQTVRGSEFGLWRKGWDSNPRYGITVYRISSPAHSTSLPPFRVRGEFEYYSMNLKKARVEEKNLLLASPGLQQRIKVPKTILRPHSGIRTKQGAKHECFAPCPYDVILSAGMRPPVWPDSAITSIRPDGEPRGRPCRDGALRAPSRSRRHSGSFRAPRRACDPRRDPSRSGCERSACALLRP